MSKKSLFILLLLATGFSILYWRVFASLVDAWWNDGNYSHGFLIVPIALYLAWERRKRFQAAPSEPSALGLALVVGSLAVLAAGILGAEMFLTRISMIGVLAGSIWFLFGRSRMLVLVFPLAFLILMIPIPAIVFNQIAFPLQLYASRMGEAALGAVDIPVLREGNVLVLPNLSLEVAEACSGIRSLVSLLTLGIVFGYFADSRAWVRTTVALSTIPIAILSNGLRVAGTGVAAHRYGPGMAEGFLHEFAGWALFVVAFLMLAAVYRVIRWLAPPAVRQEPAKAVA